MTRFGRAVERARHRLHEGLVDVESERILSILDVMYADAPYAVTHPTVTELITTMLVDLKPLE